jgi:hypothetical protein
MNARITIIQTIVSVVRCRNECCPRRIETGVALRKECMSISGRGVTIRDLMSSSCATFEGIVSSSV